jgi:uncharacterized protein (TIGR00106 family)
MKTVNIAVQLLPKAPGKDTYGIIDKAIEYIQQSGVKYQVCPFETVMEGEYAELMEIVSQIQEIAFQHGSTEVLLNLKIQRGNDTNITIDDKMHKYKV